MNNHDNIQSINDTIKSLQTARFRTGNWAGWVIFSSSIRHRCWKDSCLAATCDPSSLGATEFVKDMNEAIRPVLDKWIKIYKHKLKVEVCDD